MGFLENMLSFQGYFTSFGRLPRDLGSVSTHHVSRISVQVVLLSSYSWFSELNFLFPELIKWDLQFGRQKCQFGRDMVYLNGELDASRAKVHVKHDFFTHWYFARKIVQKEKSSCVTIATGQGR